LVVIKGRRRVGKSRLAREFAKQLQGWRSVVLTGLAPDDKVTAADEREDFAQQVSRALSIRRDCIEQFGAWTRICHMLCIVIAPGHFIQCATGLTSKRTSTLLGLASCRL